jgi:hypothetical protein
MSLLLASILILVGSMQLYFGWEYGEAAKREATAIGVIAYKSSGKNSSYNYAFEIDGVRLIQDSDVCKTAITPQGCEVGAQVLVYYAHIPVLVTRLQEFGAARREKYFMGSWMAICGLLLIGLYFFLKKTLKDSGGKDDPDESGSKGDPDGLNNVAGG